MEHIHQFWKDSNPPNCLTCGKTHEEINKKAYYDMRDKEIKARIVHFYPNASKLQPVIDILKDEEVWS